MDALDRRLRLVHQRVGAGRAHVARARVEVHLHVDPDDPGLRQALVLLEAPLVLRLQRLGLVLAAEAVQRVGVVADEEEEPEPQRDAGRRRRQPAARDPPPRQAQAGAPARRAPADQQQPRDHQQHRREREVVEVKPRPGAQVRPVAVHRREGRRVEAARDEEVVGHAERAHRQQGDVVDDHQADPEVLVVGDHVQEERDDRRQRDRGEHEAVEVAEVDVELELGVALDRLDEHAGEDQRREQRRVDQQQRAHLAGEDRAGAGRRRVAHLVAEQVALAPDQRPRVERRQQEVEEPEAADHLDHRVGDRVHRRAVEQVGVEGLEERQPHPDHHQRDEGPVAHDVAVVEAHERRQARQLDARAARGGHGGEHPPARGLRRPRLRRARPPELAREGLHAEEPIGPEQREAGDPEPERPVGQPQTVRREEAAVLLGDGPVALDQRGRVEREGVEHR